MDTRPKLQTGGAYVFWIFILDSCRVIFGRKYLCHQKKCLGTVAMGYQQYRLDRLWYINWSLLPGDAFCRLPLPLHLGNHRLDKRRAGAKTELLRIQKKLPLNIRSVLRAFKLFSLNKSEVDYDENSRLAHRNPSCGRRTQLGPRWTLEYERCQHDLWRRHTHRKNCVSAGRLGCRIETPLHFQGRLRMLRLQLRFLL